MKLFISPPFGNYLDFNNENIYSIKGSFTLKPRSGLFWQIIKTLRYNFKEGGWQNKIGLRNPGIEWALQKYYNKTGNADGKSVTLYQGNRRQNHIISIAIMNKEELPEFNRLIPKDCNIELNVSCPNVKEEKNANYKQEIYGSLNTFPNENRKLCIVKLSPLDTIDDVTILYEQSNIRQFHCSNTLPLEDGSGGLSGPKLRLYTTRLVKQIKEKYDDVEIIAGGGIRSEKNFPTGPFAEIFSSFSIVK